MFTNGLPLPASPSSVTTPPALRPGQLPQIPAEPPPAHTPSAGSGIQQKEMEVLSAARQYAAADADFKPGMPSGDVACQRLAGLVPALKLSTPRSVAEQQARDVLESTLRVINSLALKLTEQATDVLKVGTSAQQLEAAAGIDRFLKTAESTMKALLVDIGKDLPQPTSPAMQQLVELMGNKLWQDMEVMQKSIEKAFLSPIAGSPGNSRPNPAQCQEIVNQYAQINARNFLAQLEAIDLPAIRKPAFDASKLVGMAAMQKELEAVAELAKAARGTNASPQAGHGALPGSQPPQAVSGLNSERPGPDELDADDEFDREQPDEADASNEPGFDDPDFGSFDPSAASAGPKR